MQKRIIPSDIISTILSVKKLTFGPVLPINPRCPGIPGAPWNMNVHYH